MPDASELSVLNKVDAQNQMVIIIIIESMTSVFNTDNSLPYNHDLFESLIVKKRIKVGGEVLAYA
ncbi:hypothetical protein CSKR_106414 [Clonorchis sinensis]|uniref:Uncharacterized protein n=1 Tax=Clonorchis sinensis TaxID=79923 RepID=A0A419QAQ2_CLOSI|nr:hypothetical protein CSKR_106414 [Clonorchis sinensis]